MHIPNIRKLKSGPRISASEYAARIDAFWKQMAPDSVAVIPALAPLTDPNDRRVYRQSSNLLYLNGFPEPHAALIITKMSGKYERKVIMLVQPKDRGSEIWHGVRGGQAAARRNFLADEAHAIDELEAVLTPLLEKVTDVYYRLGENADFDRRFQTMWVLADDSTRKTLRDPSQLLKTMRLRKSAQEVAMIRHACAISAQAHVAAMQATRPGMGERQLQGALEGMFLCLGGAGPAYATIVAGGNNGFSLHYPDNKDPLVDGELVLVDAACEFGGYMSDITRVWPVSGKFSAAQREIYELVLKAQEATLAAVRPGLNLRDTQQVSDRVLKAGLKKLGILTDELDLADFFPHGTSHWIGLEVHDRVDDSWDDPFKSGMVLTVEPGLYFHKTDRRVPAKYRGIHVRIEDTVAVTRRGCEVLTAGVPKSIADIEQLMAQPR